MIKLTEVKRSELLNKSKKGANYNGKKINRWNNKSKCFVANTVKDYNQIDMNTFWKKDILRFAVKVKGETDTYTVTIVFANLQRKIQQHVKSAKNKFDRDIIAKALMDAISSSDVKVDCNCPDFKYRLAYHATKQGFKAGEEENRAANITNPNDDKGALCKHIIAALNNASWIRNVASVIVNYANYCRDNMEYNYSRFIFPAIFNMQYNKAVQLCLDDFDENGNPLDDLKTNSEIINIANAIAKSRFKGNKKKEQPKKEEPKQETDEKEQDKK